jgi:hypothetical protein
MRTRRIGDIMCDDQTSSIRVSDGQARGILEPQSEPWLEIPHWRLPVHMPANGEETSMKKLYFGAASGAALLALASFANAQGTGTGSSSSGAASNQCWDMSSNTVRDKNRTTATGPAAGSTIGTGSSGTASSGSTGSAASGSGSSSTATRPAGMPNC